MAKAKKKQSLQGREGVSLKDVSGEVGVTREEPPPKQFPIFITSVSLLQVFLFYFGDDNLFHLLEYDPNKQLELWRFFTVMLVHESWVHLWSNIVFQLILGSILEKRHHWRRISILYIGGVLGGSLAVAVFEPQSYGVGASSGAYALLFAHLANIILNWNEMDKKACRLFWLLLWIFLDFGLTLYIDLLMRIPLNVSHTAHFGGAFAGFIVGVLVLRTFESHTWKRRLQVILGFLMVVLFATVGIINVDWQNHYKNTEWNTNLDTFLRQALQMIDDLDKPSLTLTERCFQDEKCRPLFMELVKAHKAYKTMSANY